MISQQNKISIIPSIHIDVLLDDIIRKLPSSGSQSRDALLKTAENSLKEVYGLWNPQAILRWLPLIGVSDNEAILALPQNKKMTLTMGCSCRFLQAAKRAMIGVYTVGNRLKTAREQTSAKQRYLDAYVLDLISLIVLEKIGWYLNSIVEKKAAEKGWKVGPRLSPGSVHGWEMAEQNLLCSLLPLPEIEMEICENGVLHPFDSVSFLIGTGPDYSSRKVGSTCQLCSNKDRCIMKQTMKENV